LPNRNRFLAAAALLSLTALSAGAEPRFSLQLTGAYTELDGLVPIESLLTIPVLTNPFYLPEFTETTVRADGKLPFESEGGTWEVIAGWRFARHFQLQVGYADFGRFSSEKFLAQPSFIPFTGVSPPLTPTPRFSAGSAFLEAPNLAVLGEAIPIGPALYALPTGLVNLDPSAVTIGLKVDHPVVGNLRVYGRLGYLRAMFDANDTAGSYFEVQEPGDENGWYWGAGLQYPVLRRVLIGGGFAQYDLNLQTLDSYQLSVELLLF